MGEWENGRMGESRKTKDKSKKIKGKKTNSVQLRGKGKILFNV
jgi:hypothetical protein